jgi:hypothetical protein
VPLRGGHRADVVGICYIFWAWLEFFTNFIQRVSICPVEINNLIDNMKPSSRIKSIARHTIVWIIWFGLHSYTLFAADIAKFGTMEWLYHTYNFLSILMVFYPAAYFMKPILYRIFNYEYSYQDDFSDFRQIVNVETVSIALIVVIYVILGVSMDAIYYSYKYRGEDAYIYGRVEEVLPYLVYASGYALYRINKKTRREKSSITTEDKTANEMT